MDNVTHSLAGLLLAESATCLRARITGMEPSPSFRVAAAVSSTIAANLPDADLFYTGVGGDRLVYMLHHRGYSHTVLVAILGAGILWTIAVILWRWHARTIPTHADACWLLGTVVVSTLVHLVLDWTNSYGVHPFWPFDDRWRYGDAMFIIEPWLWAVCVPALAAASRRRAVQGLLWLVLLAGVVLAWRVPLVSPGAAAALTVGAVACIGLARVLQPGVRVATAIAGWVTVTAFMAAGTSIARKATIQAVHDADPAATLLDVVVSPFPGNAVCSTVITVERSGGRYRVATGRASAAPQMTQARQCGSGNAGASSSRTSSRRSTPSVQWDTEWSAPEGELSTMARTSCTALAALRFIRVPIWRAVDDSTVLLSDVRYLSAAGNGFTDVRVLRRSTTCPRHVPPWVPPRQDLLGL